MGCHVAMQAPKGRLLSRAQAEAAIAAFDMDRYARTLVAREHVDPAIAAKGADLLKKTMLVFAMNPGQYVWMHKEADDVLHMLLLYPDDFAKFCDTVFGERLHHRPMLPGDELPEPVDATVARTRRLWRELYGEDYDAAGTVRH